MLLYFNENKIIRMIRPIRKFFHKIKKIISYLPYLWKDEDWDWCFILDLLIYKLERTRDCLIRNDIFVGVDLVACDISETIYLLKLARNDFLNETEALEMAMNKMSNCLYGWWD